MKDTLFILFCIVFALVVGAYLIRIRKQKDLSVFGSKQSSTFKSKWLRWSNIIVIVALLVLVLGFFMLRSVFMLWISMGVLIVALVLGQFLKQWK